MIWWLECFVRFECFHESTQFEQETSIYFGWNDALLKDKLCYSLWGMLHIKNKQSKYQTVSSFYHSLSIYIIHTSVCICRCHCRYRKYIMCVCVVWVLFSRSVCETVYETSYMTMLAIPAITSTRVRQIIPTRYESNFMSLFSVGMGHVNWCKELSTMWSSWQ